MKPRIQSLSAFALISTLAILLTACGASMTVMKKAAPSNIGKASPDKAQIVFMRTSFVASAISAELFDVTDGDISFIGAISMGSKVAYETTPGKKVIMAYGTAADFMLADVEAGKTYYSIVRPNWGTGGFAPTPIRRDGSTDYNTDMPRFSSWVNDTTLMEADRVKAEAWFKENKETIQRVYKEYWKRFQTKNAMQKAERTLLPQDGM